MSTYDGDANLVRAFELVSQCGKELNGLCETLTELFEEELSQVLPDLRVKYEGRKTDSVRYDPSGWVCTDYAESFPLKKKQSTSPDSDMYIGYQLSMHESGLLPEIKSPLIHVFLWECKIDLDDDGPHVRFPVDLVEAVSLDSSRLLIWGKQQPEKWTERQWTFSVRLTAMNNRHSLLESVVRPARELLEMKSALEALPDNLPGLVMYPDSVIPSSDA